MGKAGTLHAMKRILEQSLRTYQEAGIDLVKDEDAFDIMQRLNDITIELELEEGAKK